MYKYGGEMNELPVIHGANNANCYKEMYGEKLFWRPKKQFLREFSAFLQPFEQERMKTMLMRGECMVLLR